MELEASKNLGGVGALLVFVGPLLSYVPRVGIFTSILSLIGAILILVALKGFADYYNEARIFNNALYAIIAAIIGGIAFVAMLFIAAADFFSALGLNLSSIQDWTSLSSINFQALNLDMLLRFVGIILLGAVILFVFLVITTVLLRRSLGLMATKTGVGLFGTTGLLLLIGAVLTIIVLGIFIVWIAFLILAIAFFAIRAQSMPPSATSTGTQTPA